MLSSIFIGLLLSIDSFGVGLTYGLKKIKIPLFILILIDIIVMAVFTLSIFIGKCIMVVLTPFLARLLSCGILIFIGSRYTYLSIKDKYKSVRHNVIDEIVIKPEDADIDTSGTLDIKEAVFLGIALSMDSFGVGIAISLGRYLILESILSIGFFNILFIALGNIICLYFNKNINIPSYLPGIILILIGLFKLVN